VTCLLAFGVKRQEVRLRTDIGRGLSHVRARVAAIVGLLAIAVDLWLVWLYRYPESIDGRWAVALTAAAAHVWLSGGDLPTVGLSCPSGGWSRWVRLGAALGLVAALCISAMLGLWVAIGWRLPVEWVAPAEIGPRFLEMCVFAPLLEEAIYRVALCVPLAALAGPRWALAASGAVFGLLHAVYGNPSPANLLGGFFLA
jgi:membrane protease YdiL (CAAX protease family)